MNRRLTICTLLLSALCLTLSAQSRMTHKEYIEIYKQWAIEDQEAYGIPASITMAQALLESDCGNSRLATEANNHFGIKCKSNWTGQKIYHDDDAPQECFRKYPSAEESFRDHSEFLDKSTRYQSLFELDVTDYKGWARGLKAAGYATNPKYAELLIKLIEDYELYLLDTQTATTIQRPKGETQELQSEASEAVVKVDVDNYMMAIHSRSGREIYINNGSEFVIARRGDSYDKISIMMGVSEKKLRKYNDVSKHYEPREGEQVYIRPKANRVTNGKLLHLVVSGETLHSISQRYGIKLKVLAKINNRSVDSILSEGQQIRLM